MRQSQKSSKRKNRAELNEEGRALKRQRKHKGLAAGNRSNAAAQADASSKRSSEKDPRIGSKKPISLVPESNSNVTKPKEKPAKPTVSLSPEKELALLESDEKLDALLERLENGEELSASEQQYVDRKLDRIDELMAILGIEFEDEDDDTQDKQQDIMHLLKQKD